MKNCIWTSLASGWLCDFQPSSFSLITILRTPTNSERLLNSFTSSSPILIFVKLLFKSIFRLAFYAIWLMDYLLLSHYNPNIQFPAPQCLNHLKRINPKLGDQIIYQFKANSLQENNNCKTCLTIYESIPEGDLPVKQTFIMVSGCLS
jgi:hypothetical protein